MSSSKLARMPVVFIGHGSPMNAIEDNSFTQSLKTLAEKIQKPKAILCVSAHWMTEGTWVTEMANPKTIHDFYGFPQALFDIKYPAPGSLDVATLVKNAVKKPVKTSEKFSTINSSLNTVTSSEVHGDKEIWGLDHGSWSVLRHMYPNADIPVLQLSLDLSKPYEYHEQIGQRISSLRDQGILILGSGNIVHNLSQIRWGADAKPFDWAIEFDEWFKQKLEAKDFKSVMHDFHNSPAGKLSVPTLEHYLPLHYILGASDGQDQLIFEYEGIQNGSISMRTFQLKPN